MAKQRTLIDVTDFLYWSGNFTGIQRTVYSLAKAVIAIEDQVELMVFQDGQYFRLNQTLDSLVKNGLKIRHVHIPTREEILKDKLIQKYASLPYGLRMIIRPGIPILKSAYRAVRPYIRTLLHKARELKKTTKPSMQNGYQWVPDRYECGKRLAFSSNDKILVFGCLWANERQLKAAVDARTVYGAELGVLIYDLIPIYHGHTFGEGLMPAFTQYLFEVLSAATHIFPISEATATDARRFMLETGITNKPKFQVIRLGDGLPEAVSKRQTVQLSEMYKKPYYICVGTIEARKNHILIYKALKLAESQGQLRRLPHLYIIGRRGWLAQDVEHFLRKDESIRKKITILNDVSDTQLAWFYRNAEFSVYPSQYEGWGLPVAESLVYGTPCITSNSSSMVEIAPTLVDMVSPYDPAALLKAMLKYSDSSFIADKRKLIADHYRSTTWQQTGQQIVESFLEQSKLTKDDGYATVLPVVSDLTLLST